MNDPNEIGTEKTYNGNDDRDHPTLIALNTAVTAYLFNGFCGTMPPESTGGYFDKDWYKVAVPGEGRVAVTLSGLPSDIKVQLGVSPVYFNSDFQDVMGSGSVSADTQAGDAYVWVADQIGQYSPSPYTLVVKFTPKGQQPTTPVCGNQVCETGETSVSCLDDCPKASVCGDYACDSGESISCPSDCGTASCTKPGTVDSMGIDEARRIAESSGCVAEGGLKGSVFCNENSGTWWFDLDIEKQGCSPACVVDVATKTAEINWRCTGLLPPTEGYCGDGTCDSDESSQNCCADCACQSGYYCYNSLCIPQTSVSQCGNGACEPGEFCKTCPSDCGQCPAGAVCGNQVCDSGETCVTCAYDCGQCEGPVSKCGNKLCESPETCSSCSSDCVCPRGYSCMAGMCTQPGVEPKPAINAEQEGLITKILNLIIQILEKFLGKM